MTSTTSIVTRIIGTTEIPRSYLKSAEIIVDSTAILLDDVVQDGDFIRFHAGAIQSTRKESSLYWLEGLLAYFITHINYMDSLPREFARQLMDFVCASYGPPSRVPSWDLVAELFVMFQDSSSKLLGLDGGNRLVS